MAPVIKELAIQLNVANVNQITIKQGKSNINMHKESVKGVGICGHNCNQMRFHGRSGL